MTFRRSRHGLANQAIFYGKRFVVYIEEDNDIDPARMVDRPFWLSFFQLFFHDSFEFKGLGGKQHVLEVARDAIAHTIPNVLFAMDADYDGFFGDLIEDERIFYTFGYGVENDIYGINGIHRIFSSIVPGHPQLSKTVDLAWHLIQETVNNERYAFLSDIIASSRERSTLDRKQPAANIDHTFSGLPVRLRRNIIFSKLREYRDMPVKRAKTRPLSVSPDNVPSHLYFELVFRTSHAVISKLSKVTYNRDSFRNACVGQLQHSFLEILTPSSIDHYQKLGNRNIAAFSSL